MKSIIQTGLFGLASTLLFANGAGAQTYTLATGNASLSALGAPTAVYPADDQTVGPFPIGFDFVYFGTTYNKFWIGSNGFISFQNTSNGCCSGQALPNTAQPNNMIAAYYEDFDPPEGGSIRYETQGTLGARQLVVEFNNVYPWNGPPKTPSTWQIKLQECTNIVEIHCESCVSDGGNYTQGVENAAGNEAYFIAGRNSTNFSLANDLVTFDPSLVTCVPPTPTLTLDVTAASVSEGAGAAATTATVSRNTDTTNPLTVNLSSDDTTEATVPVSVTIAAGQSTSAPFDIDAVDDAAVDGAQTVTVTASAAAHTDGTDTLDVTDDDFAGFSVTESGGGTEVSESGTSDTFAVVLNTQPVSDVVLDVTSADTGEATVDQAMLTFTNANWDQPQTVTVTGVDDAAADGDQTTSVTLSVDDAASDDAFDPLADQTVSVITIDDEVRTFTGPTATGTGDATLTITGSTCALDLAQTAFIPADGLVLPPDVGFLHGAVNFHIMGCEPGATVEVTLTWPSALLDTEGWKLDATADPFAIPGATVEGNILRYSITDGGVLDRDGVVDGNMDDPSAPGVADPIGPPVKEIPTLDEWAKWLLTGLLALLGWGMLGMRRRL